MHKTKAICSTQFLPTKLSNLPIPSNQNLKGLIYFQNGLNYLHDLCALD